MGGSGGPLRSPTWLEPLRPPEIPPAPAAQNAKRPTRPSPTKPRAPASQKLPRDESTSATATSWHEARSIPWFLCGALRDKGTTTPESRLALHPVVPLSRIERQRNHDRRNRRRSSSRGSSVAHSATKEPRPGEPGELSSLWSFGGELSSLGSFWLAELAGLGAWEAIRGEGWGVPLHVLRRWRGKNLGAAGGDPASQASEEGHPTPPRPTPSLRHPVPRQLHAVPAPRAVLPGTVSER